ncbi:MAG: type II secretion system protein GspG [Acidobacteria bacterium]|nr:type II secretion system protein GspG [Acidobacteriota bacterium]MCB9396908.1 type II secretion system protein GspG [Acidobacteriota bacterium]
MKKGFGIIDILNGILILALAASFVVPVIKQKDEKAKYKESVKMLRQVAAAMERHYLETGSYPVFENFSEIAGTGSSLVSGEYIENVPGTDAWGRPFQGKSDGKEYTLEGFSVRSSNEKMVSQYNDYKFSTGSKFNMKGQRT